MRLEHFDPDEHEWICGEHWRRIPRRLRLVHHRVRRRRRQGWHIAPEVARRVWRRLRKAVMESYR